MKDKRGSIFTVREIALMGMMVATLVAGKLALMVVPNVEIVSLLVILYTLVFGRKTIFAVLAFIALECLLWGFGIWAISYLYIWPGLVLLVIPLRKLKSVLFWSIFSALFGLLFGALCSLAHMAVFGPAAALAWWIAGIPWDVLHGVSNFVIMLVLHRPLTRVLMMLDKPQQVRE